MRRFSGIGLLLAVLVAPGPVPGADPDSPEPFPYDWVDLGDGVYAALQPTANRFNDSNSVVIVNDEDVVVVDTQNYADDVEALIARIRSLTDKPVRYVVNTHWHGDHTQSNAVYRKAFPGVEIVGHPTLAEDIPGRAEPQLEQQRVAYRDAIPAAEERLAKGVSRSGEPLDLDGQALLAGQIESAREILAAMEAVEFAVPTQTVADELVLERGERRILIRHHSGHTRGDLVVFLPREKILVTGDLLDDLPYGGHGYPRQWVETLKRLEALDFETQIPGHGAIRRGKDQLRLVLEMFETIVAAAEKAEEGTTLEQLQAALDLDDYRTRLAGDDPIANRAFDQFVPPTIERAWLEARGELED